MIAVLEQVKNFKSQITLTSLSDFVNGIDCGSVKYAYFIVPPEEDGGYGRHICCEDPFECVVVHWPPGVQSAVHLHDGLIGCVLVLEGQLENITYKESTGVLEEVDREIYNVGECMDEKDGAIHMLCNHSLTARAVTLHFYSPAMASFDDMRIYNTKTGDIGILNEKATAAVWSEDETLYKKLLRKAFTFVPLSSTSR